jgi:hypothetical protein
MLPLLLAAVAATPGVESVEAPASPVYRHSSFGVLSALAIGTGLEGDHLSGELGLQVFGLRSFGERRWLVFWDGTLALKLGGLANEYPYRFFGGGVLRASSELGRRVPSAGAWAAYGSVRGAVALQALGTPGVDLWALNTINNSDGFGGATAQGAARASAGASYLALGTSFVTALFFQQELRAPRSNTPWRAFSELGVSARVDLEERFSIAVEALFGVTPQAFDPALGVSTRTDTLQASGFLRKTFRNQMWLGVSASIGRDGARVGYAGGATFDTARPLDFALAASFGVPVGVKP